jgi:NAD-dependent DNA ligase
MTSPSTVALYYNNVFTDFSKITKQFPAMTQQDYIALVNQANRASYEYYVLSRPSMSDADFDKIIMYLEGCEYEHPEWIVPDSPTQRVGSDLSANGRRTIAHRTPMLSCQKAQTVEAVESWKRNIMSEGLTDGNLLLSWKYDGISCSLVYVDGILIEASTRGDGEKGQDILPHVSMMPSVPKTLAFFPSSDEETDYMRFHPVSFQDSGRIEIRGEIVCPKNILSKLSNSYKDCRTAASSLCNMTIPDADCSKLVFCVWDVDFPKWPTINDSHSVARRFVSHVGFNVDYLCVSIDDEDGMSPWLQEFTAKREALQYPTDGVVICLDNKRDFRSLGSTAHHPHGSIAYKFSAQKAVTTCTRIEVTTGKSGRRTPVAYFSPVTILGREVSRASLYSELNAAKLGITVGSTIEVGLSNDVTPKVYRVISPADNHPSQDGSVCGDIIATTAPSVPVDVPTVQEEEEEDSLWIAPSLFPEEELTQLASDQDSDQVVPLDEVVCDDGRDTEQTLNDSSSAPVTSFAAIAAATLSILAIVLLVPAAIAAIAFGFPLFNGSFKVS